MNGNQNERSSEDLPVFTGLGKYQEMLRNGQIPLLPTPVVTDTEIGVLPADILPDPITTSTTTTAKPKTTAAPSDTNRRTDTKYILRGNKIVLVEQN
jgi:hypothetical protein